MFFFFSFKTWLGPLFLRGWRCYFIWEKILLFRMTVSYDRVTLTCSFSQWAFYFFRALVLKKGKKKPHTHKGPFFLKSNHDALVDEVPLPESRKIVVLIPAWSPPLDNVTATGREKHVHLHSKTYTSPTLDQSRARILSGKINWGTVVASHLNQIS